MPKIKTKYNPDEELIYRLVNDPENMLLARRLVRRQPDWQELFLILGIDDDTLLDPYRVFDVICPQHNVQKYMGTNRSWVCPKCKGEKNVRTDAQKAARKEKDRERRRFQLRS